MARPFEAPLPRDFRDMLVELQRAGAEFLIVGGFAVAAHGHRRATEEIDILVRPTRENAALVHAAIGRFGAPYQGLVVDDLAAPGVIFRIGSGRGDSIDITTTIDGVLFDEARDGMIDVELDGLRLPFIGREPLLKNKRAAGRPRDLDDVAALERLPPRGGPR